MIKSFKIQLLPTKKQEEKLYRSVEAKSEINISIDGKKQNIHSSHGLIKLSDKIEYGSTSDIVSSEVTMKDDKFYFEFKMRVQVDNRLKLTPEQSHITYESWELSERFKK